MKAEAFALHATVNFFALMEAHRRRERVQLTLKKW